ncbi:MAG: glycerate 2-kinase [Moorella sp. (in: firmicutes)]|jgi:glycerate kinase|uniref:glycerate kinase n=1 Tax=unclassified Neomoorella TaxID=2676739 RepID=UPI0010FFC729|nr:MULTISPECIES: glycerate kinase [unclassified Moorella (in: firmicutes)]MDK2817592.1 glycerate 2-kinase [Moorella sp. (in: firmicutes)]GEA14934.1 glycerate kinase [Moorella sp. E308F]GEA17638.1 glycerate kinase [Moorella sp. E306M]
MKRIVIAPDSFKESLDAPAVAAAIAEGIKRVFPEAETVTVPMADGGEGLTTTLVAATGGRIITTTVTGPLGEPVRAAWGILGDGTTAVVEMAQASGLPLVPREKRNPLFTTTYGTGELIRQALDAGCRRLIVGIGGSATNDGGAGMAQALGVKLLDARGQDIGPGAAGLEELERIEIQGLDPRVKEAEILVACDVDNPLCGPRGASAVYGPQKGATPEMVPRLDAALARLADTIERDLGKDVRELPGAGAAGGLGAGLVAFLGAGLRRGIELVIETVDLDGILARGADLVITGEGEINHQTAFGKVPAGVARVAGKYGIPVVALVGSIGEGAGTVYDHGIKGFMSIVPRPVPLAYCLENAATLLADAAERLVRLLTVMNK